MVSGMELLLATICNATFCDPVETPMFVTSWEYSLTDEIVNEVNGKHLKVATIQNQPLSWVEEAENGKLIGRGVAFDVVEILRQKYNFTYDVVLPKKGFEFGGSRPEHSIVGLVNSTLVDFAAVFLSNHDVYRERVWFSHTLDVGVWAMMLKRPKASAAGTGLLAPFTSTVWYIVLVTVLLYGLCITSLTRLRNRLVTDDEASIPLGASAWFVYGSFFKQGSNLAPKANTTRILFTTWWIFIFLLSAFYTANLTAFITLSKFTLDIETPQDLYKKNYRWMAPEGTTVQFTITNPQDSLYYLNGMVAKERGKFRTVNSSYEFLDLVDSGVVLIKEQLHIYDLMLFDYQRKAKLGVPEVDRCTYVIAPKVFMTKLRGFAYPQGSKLRALFDRTLAYVIQSGIIDVIKNKNLPRTKICPLDLKSTDRQLRNSDLFVTFMVLVVGTGVAIVIFIGELYIKRHNLTIPKGDIAKRKQTRFEHRPHIHHYDDCHPPSYDSIYGQGARIKITKSVRRKIVNGREYLVFNAPDGGIRLIPLRTPSAFLYKLDHKESN